LIVADERTVNDVKVYRDSAGFYREYPIDQGGGSGGGANAAAPAITSTYTLASAQDGYNATVVRAGTAMLVSLDAYNARAGGVTLALYDQATQPTVGTDQPKWTVYLQSLDTTSRDYPTGLRFANGIAYAMIPDDAGGLMAGDVRSLNMGIAP
jgi:hypothetical protein